MFQLHWILKLCTVITLAPIRSAEAQLGSDCSETKACYEHQSCYYGYCSCDRGYVRNDKHCFRVKSYGETCFFDVQCNDHRMVCNVTEPSSTVKRCICDRLHAWNEEKRGCMMTMNVTAMLAELNIKELSEELSKEDQKVFIGIVTAGVTVVILGVFLAFICVFYGCCLYECFDTWDRLESGEGRSRSKCDPTCPHYAPSTTPVSWWRR